MEGICDKQEAMSHLCVLSVVQPAWTKELTESYDSDSVVQNIMPQLLLDSNACLEYQLEKGLLKFKGKLYVGTANGIRRSLIKALHDSTVGGNSDQRECSLYFTGLVSNRKVYNLFRLVTLAREINMKMFPILDCCNHFQFLNRLERI